MLQLLAAAAVRCEGANCFGGFVLLSAERDLVVLFEHRPGVATVARWLPGLWNLLALPLATTPLDLLLEVISTVVALGLQYVVGSTSELNVLESHISA